MHMDDEFSIHPVDIDPVEPAALPAVPKAVARGTVETIASTAPPPATDQLGDAVGRSELAAGAATEPADVESRATVHDAAAHGNPIAQAIERASAAPVSRQAGAPAGTAATDIDPNAQMLGGAAASAGSGQAARLRVDGAPAHADDVRAPDPSDRLAPVTRGSDEQGRQRRNEQSARLLPDDDEDGVADMSEG
jgi:hypothetical protein